MKFGGKTTELDFNTRALYVDTGQTYEFSKQPQIASLGPQI